VVVIDLVVHEVVIPDSMEQEAQDAVRELRFVFTAGELWLKLMDDVHLQVHELTVDAVFRWGMEMGLEAVESCLLNVLVEEADGGSLHYIVLWLSFHDDLELLTSLLVPSLFSWVDGTILYLEAVILEILADLDRCVQIDRCTLLSERAEVIGLIVASEQNVGTVGVGLHLLVELFIEVLEVSSALLDRIPMILGEVLLVSMLVIMTTSWHASNKWHSRGVLHVSLEVRDLHQRQLGLNSLDLFIHRVATLA
jgi:hypothetical protein